MAVFKSSRQSSSQAFGIWISITVLFIILSMSCKSSFSEKKSIQNSSRIDIDYLGDEVQVDGILDESFYKNLDKYYLVNSITGDELENMNYLSYFTIHHDRQSVFFSFTSFDQHIYSDFQKRDDHLWKQECIEVFIDTDSDPKNYVELEISPASVLFDSFIINPDVIDVEKTSAFDLESIKYAVSIFGTLNDPTDIDIKWNAEISINLNELDEKFNPNTSKWRMNMFRINQDKAPEKYMAYSPTFGKFHKPEKFVDCIFIDK